MGQIKYFSKIFVLSIYFTFPTTSMFELRFWLKFYYSPKRGLLTSDVMQCTNKLLISSKFYDFWSTDGFPCTISLFPVPTPIYPASRRFSLPWILAFTKSFAWLCCRGFSRGVNKPTTPQTSYTNDFVNAKSHTREKRLLAA